MDQPDKRSSHVGVTRSRLLHVTGRVGLLICSGPGFAQGSTVNAQRREKMDIKRNGSRPSGKAPEAYYFSDAVRVEPVFQVGDPVRFNGGSVTFEPGARTAWHTHS
jgi:hypothetical protein